MARTQIYSWLDTGAPSLIPGTAGSFIGVLDAVLGNTNSTTNSKSIATMSRNASGLVTTTELNHGRLTGDWVSISGATDTTFNTNTSSNFQYAKITVIDNNTWTYQCQTTGVVASAGGTITVATQNGGGYNARTITSAIRGSDGVTVTVTDYTHGRLNGDWVTITGSTDNSFNTNWAKITLIDGDHYTYQSIGSAGTAPGTITIKKASAGWITPFTTTANYRTYKSPNIGYYVQIYNIGSNTTSFQATMFSGMTGYNTGTSVQTAVWQYQGLTNTSYDSTARPWMIIVNDSGKMVHVLIGGTSTTNSVLSSIPWSYGFFGEFSSLAPNDVGNFIIGFQYNGGSVTGVNLSSPQNNLIPYNHGQSPLDNITIGKDWYNTTPAPICYWGVDYFLCNISIPGSSMLGGGNHLFPDATSGGAVIQPSYLWEYVVDRRFIFSNTTIKTN